MRKTLGSPALQGLSAEFGLLRAGGGVTVISATILNGEVQLDETVKKCRVVITEKEEVATRGGGDHSATGDKKKLFIKRWGGPVERARSSRNAASTTPISFLEGDKKATITRTS